MDTHNHNPLQEHFFGQGTYADNNNPYALDNLAQVAYNDFVQNHLFKGINKEKQYPYYGVNLLNMHTQSNTTKAGEIRKNNKGEKYWCADPDAEDFGENSVKYKMLSALGSQWKNSNNGGEKYKLETASNMIRTYEANIDADDINKVLLLNDEHGANLLDITAAGHNAVMLVSSKGEGVLFSFFPEGNPSPRANGQMRFKLLTAKQVATFKGNGKIPNVTALGKYSSTIQDEIYTRYIEIPIKPKQGSQMLERGLEFAVNPKHYLLIGNQCDDTASDIMSAGDYGYYVSNMPNWSFENASDDWRIPIRRMRR